MELHPKSPGRLNRGLRYCVSCLIPVGKHQLAIRFPADMEKRRLPIFIATPFIGQGDIHNEEWIDGRIALFEAVTKDSLLNLVGDDVHWIVFLGRDPLPKVEEYATSLFEDYDHIHAVRLRHNAENINMLAGEYSPEERYITTIIADDDAWPKDYASTIRMKANELLDEGHEHAGLSFANGLEWVMADQVDINFLHKSNFHILRKQNLVEYRYPWLGCGFFVLQTKSRPFKFMTVAHPQIPKYLEQEGFSIHVAEEPRRAWLYNRHQLSASSLVKSEEEPQILDLDALEEEFGINAELVRNWPNTRFSTYYSEKAQGVGMLEMYSFPDLSDFVHMPFKSFYFQHDHVFIDPVHHFNIQPPFRIRLFNITTGSYEMLLTSLQPTTQSIQLHRSLFAAGDDYKFDVQREIEGAWQRVMPFVLLKDKELERPTAQITCRQITTQVKNIESDEAGRVTLSSDKFVVQIMGPLNRLTTLNLNDSFVGKGKLTLQKSTDGGWKLLQRSRIK